MAEEGLANLEKLLEIAQRDLLALEQIVLLSFTVHQKETVGHHTEQGVLLLWREVQILFEIASGLSDNER